MPPWWTAASRLKWIARGLAVECQFINRVTWLVVVLSLAAAQGGAWLRTWT